MTDLARRGLVARAERLDRAVVAVQTRLAPLFPGGEIQDTGRALWTLSATPLPVVNGVIRYDARDFGGPESERYLDSCLAVLSTYDVPWRISAWEHLGAELLMPQLIARGLIGTRRAPAMWLDVPTRAPRTADENDIEIRPAANPSHHHLWTQIFIKVFGIPSEYADVFELIVGQSHSFSAVALAAGRPAGCMSMAIQDDLAVVDNIGVLPSFRRRGIGRRLLEAAHEAAAARGAKACVVVANPAGSGICARLGYHVVTCVTHLMPVPAPAPDAFACASSGLRRSQRRLADQPTLP